MLKLLQHLTKLKKNEKIYPYNNRRMVNDKIIIIESEWKTYEELEDKMKKEIPMLDESKSKTFIIEPFFFENKNTNILKKYYER